MIDEPKIGCFEKRANPFFRRMSKELADLAKNNPELLKQRLADVDKEGRISWPVPAAFTKKLSKARQADARELAEVVPLGNGIPREAMGERGFANWKIRRNTVRYPIYDHYTHKRDMAFMPELDSPNFSEEAHNYFKALSGSNAEVRLKHDSPEIGRFYKLLTGNDYVPPKQLDAIDIISNANSPRLSAAKNNTARYAGVPVSALSDTPVGQYGAERFGEMLFTPHLADPIPSLNFIRGKEGLPQLAKDSENWIHSMPYSAGKGNGADPSSWFAREVLRTSKLDVAGKGNWPKDLFEDVTRTVKGQKYKGRFYETVLPQSKTADLQNSLQSLFYLSNVAPKNARAIKVSDLFTATNGKPLLFKGGNNSTFISSENDGMNSFNSAFRDATLGRLSKEDAKKVMRSLDNEAAGWWLTPNIRTAIDYSGAPSLAGKDSINGIKELYAIKVPKQLKDAASAAMHDEWSPKRLTSRVWKVVRMLRAEGKADEAEFYNDILLNMLKRMKETQ